MNYALIVFSFLSMSPGYRKLAWSDFRGPVPQVTKWAAVTVTDIILSTTEEDGICTFNVGMVFDSSKSWTSISDAKSLLHEQLHFDLTVVWYRKITAAMTPYQHTRKEKEANRVFDKMITEWRKAQENYDLQSSHGSDVSGQKRWEGIIERELATCGIFSDLAQSD